MDDFEGLNWLETFELLTEMGSELKPFTVSSEDRVVGCQSKTWIRQTDNGMQVYSESPFIGGILILIGELLAAGKSPQVELAGVLKNVTPQRRFGLLAAIEKYTSLHTKAPSTERIK